MKSYGLSAKHHQRSEACQFRIQNSPRLLTFSWQCGEHRSGRAFRGGSNENWFLHQALFKCHLVDELFFSTSVSTRSFEEANRLATEHRYLLLINARRGFLHRL
ncbi:hypothetical protein DICVIV_14418 [Dictyocaulus viviparus]|uniref:Uncharacterized protein n=1 Tax=Dictyocaulus viviparus TaxID=29172 RepID=A0A0D8X7E8_DICVI|nr:hypothetical protein DICVIV_14418 [Dictyocaulus viviparus]